jgi:hypothetical protein
MTMTRAKAIREFCKNDCCAGDIKKLRECHLVDCPLHPYRCSAAFLKKLSAKSGASATEDAQDGLQATPEAGA